MEGPTQGATVDLALKGATENLDLLIGELKSARHNILLVIADASRGTAVNPHPVTVRVKHGCQGTGPLMELGFSVVDDKAEGFHIFLSKSGWIGRTDDVSKVQGIGMSELESRGAF